MRNNKLILTALLSLAGLILTFTVHWYFIALAVFFSVWGWRIMYN